jgi:hypothetical protein
MAKRLQDISEKVKPSAYGEMTQSKTPTEHIRTAQTPDDNNDLCIKGSAITPGHPETLCSLRPENFGAFAIAIHFDAKCTFHNILQSSNAYVVIIHIDNKTVRQRLLTGIPDHM